MTAVLSQIPYSVLKPGGDAATALYIVAFSLFIIGVKRGTHPRTAKHGNMIAALGMAIAVLTTLLLDGIGNWGLIALGLGIGTAIGVIASIRVQMTEMPQMVALYNGVGGGAVALIAWSEIRQLDATSEAFRNLWFHTGDPAWIDEDGLYHFADRTKDSVRRCGENVSTFEVESVVNTNPSGAQVGGLRRSLRCRRKRS